MKFAVIYEKVIESGFPEGYYYAHVPSLGLTTHGFGVEGAKSAINDLLKIWIDEKINNGEEIVYSEEQLFSTIEI